MKADRMNNLNWCKLLFFLSPKWPSYRFIAIAKISNRKCYFLTKITTLMTVLTVNTEDEWHLQIQCNFSWLPRGLEDSERFHSKLQSSPSTFCSRDICKEHWEIHIIIKKRKSDNFPPGATSAGRYSCELYRVIRNLRSSTETIPKPWTACELFCVTVLLDTPFPAHTTSERREERRVSDT